MMDTLGKFSESELDTKLENAKLLWSFYGPGLHVKNCEVGGWVEGWLGGLGWRTEALC